MALTCEYDLGSIGTRQSSRPLNPPVQRAANFVDGNLVEAAIAAHEHIGTRCTDLCVL